MLKFAFVAITVIGLAMSGFGVYFIALGNQARSWPVCEGKVLATAIRIDSSLQDRSVTQSQRERHRRYYPVISYRWTAAGVTQTGSRYRLGDTFEKFGTREEAQAAAKNFPPGSAIKVYCSPDNPADAVLDNSTSAGVYVPLPLGLLFLAFGLFGLRRLPMLSALMAQ